MSNNHRDAQRVILILVDDCKVPSSAVKLSREIAHAIVGELRPGDLAAVVYTYARDEGQEFTIDRARLRASIERLVSHAPAAPLDGPFSASQSGDKAANMRYAGYRGGQSGMCNANPREQALRNAAEVLRAWPGTRKTLALIGPGGGFSFEALQEPGQLTEIKETFAALQEANINVYQYDPQGLRVDRPPDDSFGEFADNTGGRAITNTNTPWTLVPQMFREQLLLSPGIPVTEPKQDGRLRRVAVKVARPNLEVRARSGYFVLKPISVSKPAKQPPPSCPRSCHCVVDCRLATCR